MLMESTNGGCVYPIYLRAASYRQALDDIQKGVAFIYSGGPLTEEYA